MDVIEGISWAPSGDRLAAALGVCDLDECHSDIHVIVLGSSGPQSVVNITPDPFSERNPAWSPDGDRIAFDSTRDGNNDVFTMDVDGGNLARLTTRSGGRRRSELGAIRRSACLHSRAGQRDAIYTMDLTGRRRRGAGGRAPAVATPRMVAGRHLDRLFRCPRGDHAAPADHHHRRRLVGVPVRGPQGERTTSRTGSRPTSHMPGRGSASPLRVSLVPAYTPCAAPNRTHGPPLGFGSCRPPSQTSRNVTVGTPDVNGAAANSAGFARFWRGSPPGGPDGADFMVELNLSDIRCGPGTGACGPANDRGGRTTPASSRSRARGAAHRQVDAGDPQTTRSFTFRVPARCGATSSTATGAVCSVYAFANALVPGSLY